MVKSVMIFDQEQYAKLNEERIKLRFSSMNPGTNEVEGFNKFKTKLSVTRKEKLVFVNMPIDMELAKLQIRISKEHLKQIEAEKARRKRDLEAGNGKEK